MKRIILVLWVLCIVSISGCALADQALLNPDGTPRTDGAVVTAAHVVSSLPIPFAGLIGAAITAIPGIYAGIRGKQWKTAAIATAQGVQAAISNLDAAHQQATPAAPASIADAIKKAIDVAHDDHGVNQGMQNALTPTT